MPGVNKVAGYEEHLATAFAELATEAGLRRQQREKVGLVKGWFSAVRRWLVRLFMCLVPPFLRGQSS